MHNVQKIALSHLLVAAVLVATSPGGASAQCPVGEQATAGPLYSHIHDTCAEAVTAAEQYGTNSFHSWRACTQAYPDTYTVPFSPGSRLVDSVVNTTCQEVGPGHPSYPTAITAQMYMTVCCYYDPNPDADNDTIYDNVDNCPNTPNQDQANNDGDAQGDACDPDDDNDGVLDVDDNCQFDANADQSDLDFDGIGDACDPVFNQTSAANELAALLTDMMGWVGASGVPGGNGLIAKLNQIWNHAVDAAYDYDSGQINAADYLQELNDALNSLDAFDNQLSGKINNGQLTNPYASDLQSASAQVRAIINAMIAGI
jgi:hypothetical protein